MKKSLLLLSLVLTVNILASERVVWSGNQPISYNQGVYVGASKYLLKNFENLTEGETIKLYTTQHFSLGDWQLAYELDYQGAGWAWTQVDGARILKYSNGTVRFTPTAEEVGYISERGLYISGCGFDLKKVVIMSANGEATIARYDSVVVQRAGSQTYFDTYNFNSSMLSDTIYQGYTIKAYIEPVSANPTYDNGAYKTGSSWTWTYVPMNITDNFLSYTVDSIRIAEEMCGKGFVFRGTDYSINRIAVQNTQNYNIWEGQEVANWDYPYNIDFASYISHIAIGDSLYITVTGKEAGEWPQLRVEWGDDQFVGQQLNDVDDYPFTFRVAVVDSMYNQMTENNKLHIRGAHAIVTKVTLHKSGFTPTETTLWTASGKAISWNQDTYTGVQFDTRPNDDITYIDFSNLQVGDVLTFHVTAGIDNPQYQLQHKSGDGWNWTRIVEQFDDSNTPTVAGKKGTFTYTVADSTAATIPSRGLIITGQGYNLDFVTRTISADNLTLSDTEDNSTKLTRLINLGGAVDLTINRTVYRDGYYNTICLPFALSSLNGTPFEDAIVREFSSAEVVGDNVYVTINDAQSMVAGNPYLVRFSDEGDELSSLTFRDVTVSTTSGNTVNSSAMNFVGILAPTELDASEDNLFLGAANTLYWPSSAANLNGFRAYFNVNSGAGAPIRGMRAQLVDGPGYMPTGIENQMVSAQAEKIIENGQIIIVKDGVKYNIFGVRQ